MDARRLLIFATLIVAASAGCKSDPYMDAYLDTVNAEKRALEDVIYDLQFENEQLKKKIGGGSTTPTSATDSSGDGGFDGDYGPLVTPPTNDGSVTPSSPFVDPPENPDLSDPMTTPGVEVDPKEIFPNLDNSDAGASLPSGQLSVQHQADPSLEIAGPGATVTHLHINRVATRGRNTDGQPGDDLLVIGLEPRDRFGRFVPAPNTVSIVLLDPELKGQEARVAQWTFDAATVAEGAQHASARPMILLEAAWPKRPPTNSRFQLWARYTTTDGRILQTKETIHITPSGDLSTRWTPRTSESAARMANRPEEAPAWSPNR